MPDGKLRVSSVQSDSTALLHFLKVQRLQKVAGTQIAPIQNLARRKRAVPFNAEAGSGSRLPLAALVWEFQHSLSAANDIRAACSSHVGQQ